MTTLDRAVQENIRLVREVEQLRRELVAKHLRDEVCETCIDSYQTATGWWCRTVLANRIVDATRFGCSEWQLSSKS